MSVTVEFDKRDLNRIKKQLKQLGGKAPNVLKLAINDTARKTKSGITKGVGKSYAIKQKDFRQYEKVQLATKAKLMARIDYKSTVLTIYKYFPYKANVPGAGKAGARIKVLKSGSFKGGDPKMFIATMPNSNGNNHTGIFQRRPGKKRGEKREIKEMLGPSAPNMVYNERNGAYDDEFQKDMQVYLMQRIQHQIDRVLGQQ